MLGRALRAAGDGISILAVTSLCERMSTGLSKDVSVYHCMQSALARWNQCCARTQPKLGTKFKQCISTIFPAVELNTKHWVIGYLRRWVSPLNLPVNGVKKSFLKRVTLHPHKCVSQPLFLKPSAHLLVIQTRDPEVIQNPAVVGAIDVCGDHPQI